MKKIILILLLALAPPLAAQEQDWKEQAMDEFTTIVESIDPATLQGPQLVIRQQISSIFWQTMYGFCVSLAAATGVPTPDSIIQESIKIHNQLLKGTIPNNQEIRDFGFNSLSYLENQMSAQGITKEQIQNQFAYPLQTILQQSRQLLGAIQ